MKMTGIPFGLTHWAEVQPSEHTGTSGMAYWRTLQFGDLRVRMAEGCSRYVSSLGERAI